MTVRDRERPGRPGETRDASAPLEGGFPLLRESGHRLGRVVGAHVHGLGLRLGLQRLGEARLEALVEQELSVREAAGIADALAEALPR